MFGIGFGMQFQSTSMMMPFMGVSPMMGMGGGFPMAMYVNASMLMGPQVGTGMIAGMGYPGMMSGNMMMGNMMPMLMQQMMLQQMQMLMMLQMMMLVSQMQRGSNAGMPYTGVNPGFLPPPYMGGFPGGPYGLGPGMRPGGQYGLGPGIGPGGLSAANLGNGVATANGVPWFSQFDGRHVPDAGSMACFRACVAMARAAGVNVLGPGSRIQVGTGEDGSGRLSVNRQAAIEGQNYIDKELNQGDPVVVGVSYAAGRDYNVDQLTDHFVIITGRGQDSNGRTYYTFNDPGTTNGGSGSDKNQQNRFYVDEKTGKLYRPGNGQGGLAGKNYEVAMVRRNA
jgi:hypothetical protein